VYAPGVPFIHWLFLTALLPFIGKDLGPTSYYRVSRAN